jgi:Tfp pilus assembly PilM family ATPase
MARRKPKYTLQVDPAEHRAPHGRSLIPASKKITLGVDIGRGAVRLVKVARIASDRWKLLECISIPFEPGISVGDPTFHEFLKASVSSLAGSHGKYDLWTMLSSANLEVRYITIPKVPKAQIPNAVHWTVKKETNFNEKESVIDFEVQGELLEKGITKIGIMAYIIPVKDIEETKDLFSRSGLKLRGITVAPAAIQNLFRSGCAPLPYKPVCVLYIGNEHSRIDIFLKGNLVLSRGMKAGIDSMIEAFAEKAYEETSKVAEVAGEEFLMASENEAYKRRAEAEALLLSIFSGSFSPDKSTGPAGLREDTVFDMIRPALGRIAMQVERTFEYFSRNPRNEKVNTIYVTCAAGHWERPFDFIADQLGIERKVLDPLYHGAILSDELLSPATVAERAPFTTAVGLALSDNVRTPNLIFTYSDKEELAKIAQTNRGIFIAFVAILLALTGVFFWQARLAGQKEDQLTRLQGELDMYNPQPNQNTIAALAGKVIAQRRALVEPNSRLLGTAVIGELVSLTPPNVRLISAKADLGSKPDEGDIKSASAKETKEPAGVKKQVKKGLVVEGIVTGNRDAQESALAGYLLKLSASRLLVHPVVSSQTTESYPDYGEVLKFSMQIGLP